MKKNFNLIKANTKKKLLLIVYIMILLFLIFIFVLSLNVCTVLDEYKSNRKNENLTISTVEINGELLNDKVEQNEEIYNINLPTKEAYENIAKLDEVFYSTINPSGMFLTSNLKYISGEKDINFGCFTYEGIDYNKFVEADLGNIDIKKESILFDEFNNNTDIISILISDSIARVNSLQIGDILAIELFNPEKEEQVINQKVKIAGLFSVEPVKNLNGKVLNLDEVQADIKAYYEHDEKSEVNNHKINELESIMILKEILYLENLNTIYMSTKSAELLANNIHSTFYNNNDVEYTATYILKSQERLNDFKKKAENILPNEYKIYEINDAFQHWMPIVYNIEKYSKMLTIIFFPIFILLFIIIVYFKLRIDKSSVTTYLLLGKSKNYVAKKLFMNYFVSITFIYFIATFLSLVSIKYFFNDFYLFFSYDAGFYYHIQEIYSNLISNSTTIIDVLEISDLNLNYIFSTYFVIIFILYIVIQINFKKNQGGGCYE